MGKLVCALSYLALGSTLLGSGGADAPPPPPTGTYNRIMGTGEARDPEPFTREQRLLHAVRQGDVATVVRALDLGVSVHARDELGRSAFLLAVRDAGSLELAQLLREHGAEIDEPDASGRTPLSYAAGRGRPQLVAYLLDQGAEVDRADDVGRTPLLYAAIGDHPEILTTLFEHGAKLDVRGRNDETPLIAACERHNAAAAQRLRELGADASLVDRRGHSAHDRAQDAIPGCGPPDDAS